MQNLPLRVVVAAAMATIACWVAAEQSAYAQAPEQFSERIADYTVEIAVEPDGTLDVHESIVYDFGVSYRHGIIRDLVRRERYDGEYDREYDLDVYEVSATEGTPAQYEAYTDDTYLHVKIGDPDRTITGPHRYDIRYRVDGGLQSYSEHVELYWDAIGTQWTVPISAATVNVRAPDGITRVTCFAGPEGSTIPCDGATAEGAEARFTQSSLGSGSGLTVVAAVPKAAFTTTPGPILVERWDLEDSFAVNGRTLGLAGGLSALGVGGVGVLAWRRGRDRRWTGSAVDAAFGNPTGDEQRIGPGAKDPGPVEFVPPDGIRPGQVGTLIDERANLLDVSATIIDLATRGRLRITELEPEGLFRRKHDYQLDETDDGRGELLSYEKAVLRALFESGPSVKLSDLKYKFRPDLERIQQALYDDVVRQGWYRARPDRTRMWWRLVGAGVVVLGIGAIALTAVVSSFGIVPVALVVTGIALTFLGGRMPARTGKGSAMLSRVGGFRRLFDEGEEDVRARFAERQGIFSEYLPYAIVFGCTERWARAFEGLDAETLGTAGWYTGRPGDGFGAFAVASAMDDFDTAATGTLYASQPSSSSGSGFSGGSSGGGGGGGGGSSW